METQVNKTILVRVPLRLSLGGGGTDLPAFYAQHGGCLTSVAIDKYVYVLIRYNSYISGIKTSVIESVQEIQETKEIKNFLLRKTLEFLPYSKKNLEIISFSDVPPNTGMGSSCSFVAALLTGFYGLHNKKLSMYQLAEEAFEIEANIAGRPIGKHDQYISVFGGLKTLRINKTGKVTVKKFNLSELELNKLSKRLLLFYTGKKRNSASILSKQQQVLKKSINKIEAMKKIKTIGIKMQKAIKDNDYDEVGKLFHEHWKAKLEFSPDYTSNSVIELYSHALHMGALGGKIIGPSGGFLLLYVPQKKQKKIINKFMSEGLTQLRFKFDFEGAKVIYKV